MKFALQRNATSLRPLLSGFYLLLALGTASASGAQTVTVTGKIELTVAPSSRTRNFSDAVVWLVPLGDTYQIPLPQSQRRLQLVQKGKNFSPHLLVVQVGAPVEFPNHDPFFHNVFSLFEGKRFDLGLYEAGSSRTVVFDREGICYIFCNIHAEMSAVVVALRTPHYGISDPKGTIIIPNVPTGRYEMHVWDERALPQDLNALTRTLQISESSHWLGALRFAEQRGVLVGHKNKYGQDYETSTPNLPVYVRP